MKRLISMLCLALLPVGCFGACGGGEPAAPDHGPTSTPPPASTTGDDATTNDDGTEGRSAQGQLVIGPDACTTDADCVPGGCCHPATCVARASAPSCVDSVCTTDCRYGTLDCGGSCLCHEGHCAAQLSAPPVIPGVTDVQ
jgi:hypothetical protein